PRTGSPPTGTWSISGPVRPAASDWWSPRRPPSTRSGASALATPGCGTPSRPAPGRASSASARGRGRRSPSSSPTPGGRPPPGRDPVGPTPEPFPGLDAPQQLSTADITAVIDSFVASAHRAQQAGFDALELHFAHGYLVHEFLSPLVNTRGERNSWTRSSTS